MQILVKWKKKRKFDDQPEKQRRKLYIAIELEWLVRTPAWPRELRQLNVCPPPKKCGSAVASTDTRHSDRSPHTSRGGKFREDVKWSYECVVYSTTPHPSSPSDPFIYEIGKPLSHGIPTRTQRCVPLYARSKKKQIPSSTHYFMR